MPNSEPRGCLSALLSLFGINLGGPGDIRDEFPVRRRDKFLSPAELSFYRVLCDALGGRVTICPKVNLADIVCLIDHKANLSFRNRYDRKHVDFLICDPESMTPRCAIELDDSSHSRRDRMDRDELVDGIFQAAGLPLIHVPAKRSYSITEIRASVAPYLEGRVAPPARVSGVPNCPRCGVPMVERVAKKGQNAGQRFYGCPNYPACKEVAQIT